MKQSRNKKAPKNNSGQATVEYILLLAIVTGIAVSLTSRFNEVMDQSIGLLGGKLEKSLKTGRAPISVWTK